IEPEIDRSEKHRAPDPKHGLHLAKEMEDRGGEGNRLSAFRIGRQLSHGGTGGEGLPVFPLLKIRKSGERVGQESMNDRAQEDPARDQVEWLCPQTPGQDCAEGRELCVPVTLGAFGEGCDRRRRRTRGRPRCSADAATDQKEEQRSQSALRRHGPDASLYGSDALSSSYGPRKAVPHFRGGTSRARQVVGQACPLLPRSASSTALGDRTRRSLCPGPGYS